MNDNRTPLPPPDQTSDFADPAWFRAPTPREHLIAATLFVGFGVFFALMFIVQRGSWFRWVILGLAVISTWHGIRHALDARTRGGSQ